MSDLFLLSEAHMRRIDGYFRFRTASHGWTTADRQRHRVRYQEWSSLA